ncbi:hypothetical protein CPLU01_14678 [Colletotrichum plurivorum]|uniref:Uncharacterized protein n=1 Tax=Colletotrichum plurivorum TaxID=2175906 RepID=A0A8H6MYY2_9PEZI|nr:hypothetical protein CPLU01_14678 [Colletotrichum plurivorum]
MSALRRVPPEVHELLVSNLESPTDVKSWMSASTVNFSLFLVYKSEIFDTHIGLHLVPEALTVLQLRQIHERSNTTVEVGQLVDVACESLKPNGPLSPRSFVPDDFDTIVSLLDLADEMNCILLEALGDPVVLSASAHETAPWSCKGTRRELESLRKATIAFLVEHGTFDFGGSRVGTLHSDAGDKTVHRLVCKPENDPFRIEHSPEFLFQRDENGLTAIASLQTIRGEKNWDQLDTIHYIWQLSSGGIHPVVRMLRLTEMERQEELIDND